MRSKPSFMFKFCLARAAECRRGAMQVLDPSCRQSWLEMEGRWFFLARSYENEQRTDFTPRRAHKTKTEDRAEAAPGHRAL